MDYSKPPCKSSLADFVERGSRQAESIASAKAAFDLAQASFYKVVTSSDSATAASVHASAVDTNHFVSDLTLSFNKNLCSVYYATATGS